MKRPIYKNWWFWIIIVATIAVIVFAVFPRNEVDADSDFCVVTFDTLGGSAVEQQVVEKGDKAKEPPAPTKECECVFDGWYLGDEKWSFIGYSVTEDITLTAKWIKCFNLNEAEIEQLKHFISSWYGGKKTWQDIDSIEKKHSVEYGCYEYIITFKDGTVFDNISIQCEYVDN